MYVEDGKIKQATENEMYSYWLGTGWCDIYPFSEYLDACKRNGTYILDEEEQFNGKPAEGGLL